MADQQGFPHNSPPAAGPDDRSPSRVRRRPNAPPPPPPLAPPPPPPPPPVQGQWPGLQGSSSGSIRAYEPGGSGFPDAAMQAVAVGGQSSASPAAGGLPSRVGLKRSWEGGVAMAGAQPPPPPPPGGGGGTQCSVCGKRFASVKALFGHMRLHPDRGWRGAHPPPSFRADEEFADIRGAIAAAAAVGQGSSSASSAAQGAGTAERQEEDKEEEGSGSFQLPDLNNPPPPDTDPAN